MLRTADGKRFRMRMDKTHISILNAIVDNPNVSTRDIAKSLAVPLSTIQRRRSLLEETVLQKNYFIDLKELGWRRADIFVSVDKGNSEKVVRLLLEKAHVLSVSTRVGHPEVNVAASVFYKNTQELHALTEETKAMPHVTAVEWSEIVTMINKKQTEMLNLIFGTDVYKSR
jgi:DNA-binding Lrp family transcriptional regulator